MRRKRSERGFTLIDTLVGMTVLAVSANAMLSMLIFSAYNVRANALNTHAVTLAIQEREDLRSLIYSAIATRDPYTTGSPDRFNGVPFTVHSDVQTDVPAANMKTVTATISWNYRGQPRSYAVQTIYTNING
jgi:Tfp pilus assembly protein PilV